MKNNYTFKHIDPSESLVDYTEGQLQEIGRFLLKDGAGQVYYSKFKNEFTVEISVNTKEKYYRASHTSNDPYAAVDGVVSKLEKQFLKTRKFHKNHKKFDLSREGYLENLNDQFEWNYRHYKKAA